MSKTADSCLTIGDWEPQKKPRCRSCGGETAQVLTKYGNNKPQAEWECIVCGKSFKVDGYNNNKRYKKHKKYNRSRRYSRR